MKELDYNPKMIMTQNSGHISPDFVKEVGKDAEGTMSRAPFSTDLIDKRPVAKVLNPLYAKRAAGPLRLPGAAFTGMMTLLDALTARARPTPRRSARPGGDGHPGDQLIMTWTG